MPLKLLWADDDCDGLLQPLGRFLLKAGFTLFKAKSYKSAMHHLEESPPDALLLDTILPHSDGLGALGSHLGIKLAHQAAALGVVSIVFLTVVRQDELVDQYSDLQRTHAESMFSYFDKTLLLEPNEVEMLISRLKLEKHD